MSCATEPKSVDVAGVESGALTIGKTLTVGGALTVGVSGEAGRPVLVVPDDHGPLDGTRERTSRYLVRWRRGSASKS